MMGFARELVATMAALILAYLVLVNSTGFSRNIAALSKAGVENTKALQGR